MTPWKNFCWGVLEDDIYTPAGAVSARPIATSGPPGRSMGAAVAETRGGASNGGNETVVVIHAVRGALQEQGVPRDSIVAILGLIAIAL